MKGEKSIGKEVDIRLPRENLEIINSTIHIQKKHFVGLSLPLDMKELLV